MTRDLDNEASRGHFVEVGSETSIDLGTLLKRLKPRVIVRNLL